MCQEAVSSLVASLLALASEEAAWDVLEAVLSLLPVLPDALCDVLSAALELCEAEVLSLEAA